MAQQPTGHTPLHRGPESIPSPRWALPYRTHVKGVYMWAIALRGEHALTTRQRLAGCASIVYAETYEALMDITIQHDQLAQMVADMPAEWSETASGSPADTRHVEGPNA